MIRNWLQEIGGILGDFWHRLFGDSNFILGVENLHAKAGLLNERACNNAIASAFPMETEAHCSALPLCTSFALPAERVSVYSGMSGSSAYFSMSAWTSGTAADRWLVVPETRLTDPACITDREVRPSFVLVRGMDFDMAEDGRMILFRDPASIGFQVRAGVRQTVTEGVVEWVPVSCCSFVAWEGTSPLGKDPIEAFYGKGLEPVSQDVWRAHVRGLSMYGLKRLLAYAADAVVCEEAGRVEKVWTEGGFNCAVIGDRLYASRKPAAPGIAQGANVATGDTVFGSLHVYRGTDTIPSTGDAGISSIVVMTDVGAMVASNSPSEVQLFDDVLPLHPLGGSSLQADAYARLCRERANDLSVPYIGIPKPPSPHAMNPFEFIAKTLRGDNGIFAVVSGFDVAKLSAVLPVIEHTKCAGCIIDIYLKSSGDVVTVPAYRTEELIRVYGIPKDNDPVKALMDRLASDGGIRYIWLEAYTGTAAYDPLAERTKAYLEAAGTFTAVKVLATSVYVDDDRVVAACTVPVSSLGAGSTLVRMASLFCMNDGLTDVAESALAMSEINAPIPSQAGQGATLEITVTVKFEG